MGRPQEIPPLEKNIDLSNSKYLIETPDFSLTTKLERLDLSGCTNLLKVHPSIGFLKTLAFLSLRNCCNLVSVDFGSVTNMSSLKVLHLSGCTKLKKTPDFKRATNLEYLDVDGCTSLFVVHDSIGFLANLTFLSLRDCINLLSIPNTISTMTSLQTLDLRGCKKLAGLPLGQAFNSSSHLKSLIFLDMGFCNLSDVPDAIRLLRCLERMNLQGNNFDSLPDSLSRLRCLSYLNLSHCHKLIYFPQLPTRWVSSGYSGGRYFKTVSGSRDHRSGLYAFDCPKLRYYMGNIEFEWLKRLIKEPNHFRCGFDIVVPWDRIKYIQRWFNQGFKGNSVIRIKNFNMDDNWIGFAFCVVFEINNRPEVSTSPPSHPFYLSFESEETEEYFDMPLNMEVDKIARSKHLWVIYMSRHHCHFVKTGAHITFKAHLASVKIIEWGMRSMSKEDVDDFIRKPHHIDFDYVKESNSRSGPKFQLPYNWLVNEEDEVENIKAKAKENNLVNVGL